jgi:hypothetical protein
LALRRKSTFGMLLTLVLLVAALATAACGGSSATIPASSPSAPTTSPSASIGSNRQEAARDYFAAMASVIDADYRGSQAFERGVAKWQQTFADNGPSDRRAWDAFGVVFQQSLPAQRDVTDGYAAITPPDTFRQAHATLVDMNRSQIVWAEQLVAAIDAARPTSDLLSMLRDGPAGATASDVITDFREAATRVGIELPPKLIEVYEEPADSAEPAA